MILEQIEMLEWSIGQLGDGAVALHSIQTQPLERSSPINLWK